MKSLARKILLANTLKLTFPKVTDLTKQIDVEERLDYYVVKIHKKEQPVPRINIKSFNKM